MKKVYLISVMMLAFFIITSTYAIAGDLGIGSLSGESQSVESSNSGDSESSVSEESQSVDSGTSGDIESIPKIPSDGGLINPSISISSGESNIIVSQLTADRVNNNLQNAQIISISNPVIINNIISFKGLVSNPESSEIGYRWDFGDGETFEKYSGEDNELICDTTHIYVELGTYIVSLSLLDKEEVLDIDTAELTVTETAEGDIGVDAGGPYLGAVGDRIRFVGYATSDEFGSIESYDWKLHDGTEKNGQRISDKFNNIGDYTVTLTVEDEFGTTATGTTTVTIGKISLNFHSPNPIANEKISFGAEVLGFTPTSYVWNFGDGFYNYGQTVSHEYSESGNYYGNLKVYDKNNNYIKSDFIILVDSYKSEQNQKPVSRFSISSNNGDTSTIFKFDASSSFDPDGEVSLYEWYFGDGKVILTRNPKCNYVFNEIGNWEVTCVVIDNDGGFESSAKIIQVTDGNTETDEDIGYQDGIIFFEGKPEIIEIKQTVEKPIIEDTRESCNLEVSVVKSSDVSEDADSAVKQIRVKDTSGNYKADKVKIKFISNIPGYEDIDYSALKDQESGEYVLDVDIPIIEESYTFSIAVSPDITYSDSDWSDNIYTESTSEEPVEEPIITIEDVIVKELQFGTIAL